MAKHLPPGKTTTGRSRKRQTTSSAVEPADLVVASDLSTTDAPADISPPLPDFPIVGVGASAGGFEAFSQMLESLPLRSGLALILVQHLSPQHGSALPKLLGPHSRIPVIEVTDGMGIEANNVYVVPPNVQMELIDRHLHLGPRPDDRSQYNPIDFFFRSLAHTLQNRAIGVILSGTASDGAVGLREIKAMGGITFAQRPETARYDGMPRAAIATGVVDLVMAPNEMAAKLAQIGAHPYLGPPRLPDRGLDIVVTDKHLNRVFKLLLPACGVDFAHYKSPTIRRRLLRRMALHRLTDVDAYLAYLDQTPEEAAQLHNDLLIHVTRFFREPEAFEVLAKRVLPALVGDAKGAIQLRAWVAGCSTGEEAYSLAMVLVEALGDRFGESRIQVFGTDVSDAAIESARHGIYQPTITADVTPERLPRFFSKTDGSYRVVKSLRDLCVFARQDLTRDPPFSRLDLICCRNVLIYLDAALQQKVLSVFHYALKPGGILMLGQAETIGSYSDMFSLVDKKYRIFQKKPGGTTRADLPLGWPMPETTPVAGKSPSATRAEGRAVLQEAHRVLLDRYAPPSVLVDQNFQIIQFNGQTGTFLEPSPGEPTFSVLKLTREGLLHGLRAALQTAQKTKKRVRQPGLRVKSNGHWRDVNIEVIPLMQQGQSHYLVLFEADSPRKRKKEPPASGRQGAGSRSVQHVRVQRLEEELVATREYLRSTIQEIEAANEELQSANEEVLSSNEELQSTNEELDTAKEELQSTNEELNTVNDELHSRNEELTRVNADLLNLLGSVQIAIVIVSNDLRIRRFTPMAEKVLNLIPTDIGRLFTQISPNIVVPGLPALITEAIDTVTPVEHDVQDREGRWYSLRIRAYKGPDNRIDGAVIAVFDIDIAKRHAQQLTRLFDHVRAIGETVGRPVMILDGNLRVKTINRAFSDEFGIAGVEAEQHLVFDLGRGEWNTPEFKDLLEKRLPVEGSVEGFRLEWRTPARGARTFLVNATELADSGDRGAGLILLTFEQGSGTGDRGSGT